MSEFMHEAEQVAGEHSDVVDKGIEQAGQMAEEKTGGSFDPEIQKEVQQAEGAVGGDRQST
jgi:MT0933-like antitoxin protein